jgi:hypothetical protein
VTKWNIAASKNLEPEPLGGGGGGGGEFEKTRKCDLVLAFS